MRHLSSRFQFELFCLAFLVSILFTWFTIIVKKDYVVFTDPETIPASSDFLANLFGSSDVESEEE